MERGKNHETETPYDELRQAREEHLACIDTLEASHKELVEARQAFEQEEGRYQQARDNYQAALHKAYIEESGGELIISGPAKVISVDKDSGYSKFEQVDLKNAHCTPKRITVSYYSPFITKAEEAKQRPPIIFATENSSGVKVIADLTEEVKLSTNAYGETSPDTEI